MASTSECSTDFEASGSVVSGSASAASQEQEYDDDEFDDYSGSFESSEPDAPGAAAVSSSTGHDLLDVGTRVQVFWREENEWFDGVIQSVAEGYEPRYHMHYDDGEQQWEVR
ncbi:hypothetical protein PI124_g181 [Phytophthora idaei]|nr:hypothetical protein PI124_g181 [Phytophthora idaei]